METNKEKVVEIISKVIEQQFGGYSTNLGSRIEVFETEGDSVMTTIRLEMFKSIDSNKDYKIFVNDVTIIFDSLIGYCITFCWFGDFPNQNMWASSLIEATFTGNLTKFDKKKLGLLF